MERHAHCFTMCFPFPLIAASTGAHDGCLSYFSARGVCTRFWRLSFLRQQWRAPSSCSCRPPPAQTVIREELYSFNSDCSSPRVRRRRANEALDSANSNCRFGCSIELGSGNRASERERDNVLGTWLINWPRLAGQLISGSGEDRHLMRRRERENVTFKMARTWTASHAPKRLINGHAESEVINDSAESFQL